MKSPFRRTVDVRSKACGSAADIDLVAMHDKPVLRLVHGNAPLREVRIESQFEPALERPRSWHERLADRERRRAGHGLTPPDLPPLAA